MRGSPNLADLDRFITALFRGRLLPPAQLDEMFTIPAVASGPFRYGMGLLCYTLPNGVTVWGHTGETPGYVTAALATRDLSRTLVFGFTPVEPANGNQVLATELAIAQAAYDPACRYLVEDLPCLLTSPAATRQITPMPRAAQPRVERCASALDAGCVIAPSMPGSDLAGSVK